jgi:LysM repeat protein
MSAQVSNFRLDRRYPSPSAQRRSGELWKARFGLVAVVLITLFSAALMFRIAGVTLANTFGLGVSPPGQTAQRSGVPVTNQGLAAGTQTQAPATAAQPAAPPAPAPPPAPTQPARREHTVQSGDSLFAIAQRYGTTIEALMQANNIRDRNQLLSVGQRLAIP